jgi:hypothetical protein
MPERVIQLPEQELKETKIWLHLFIENTCDPSSSSVY